MNRNRVFAGLVVLALLWAGNVFYFEKHKLKEPIFLKHYYDLTLYGNELNLELFYFTNVQDNVKNLQIQLLGQDVLFLIIGENTTVKPILPRSSGGSSDSRSFAQFELGQPGKVEKIEFPKDHPAQDIYHLSVDGQPWQGAPLPTDFQSLIRIDNQITAKPGNIYAGELIIQFQMKDGSRQFGKMPVHANPPYQEAEIRKIVEGALQ